MNIRIILFVISLIFVHRLSAQTEVSKEQLIEDFDYLYEVLQATSVSMDIFSLEHNINIDSIYKNIRNEFLSNVNFDNFIKSTDKLLHISADKHNHFVWSSSVLNLVKYLPDNERKATFDRLDTTNIELSNKNIKLIYKYKKSIGSYRRYEKLRYFKGNYITAYDLKTDLKQKIPYGSIITSINNKSMDEIVNQNIGEYFLYFDVFTKKYYSHNILEKNLSKNNTTILSYNRHKNEKEKIVIDSNNNIHYHPNILTLNYTNKVLYSKKEKILYVVFLDMNFSDELKMEFEKIKHKQIDKVVFDIRNNQGGSDMEWIKLLSYTIDSLRVKETPELLIKNSKTMKTQFKGISLKNNKNDKYLEFKNDILDNIKPDTNGLNFKGKIYCIINENTFSSAMAFASMNMYLNNFYIVGNEAPYYGGLGGTPLYFTLPNTKLFFRVNSTFDKKMYEEKVYRLQIDLNIQPNITKELKFINKAIKNYGSKTYLFRNNAYFNAIRKLK